MKLTITLRGQCLLNFRAALAALHWPDDARAQAALAEHLLGAASDSVARAGWFRLPLGSSMELRPWTSAEWEAHRCLTGNPAPLVTQKGGAS